MHYRIMGKTGVETSLLGYGCMRFPTLENGKIDRYEATRLLLKAYENGVNYFDTAWPYHGGESERFVGEFFRTTGLRDKVYLATKLPVWEVEKLEDAERIFDEQLKHLKTDYIDFYLLHALNAERFDKMVELGVVKLLEGYKEEGKIKNFGFSFHDSYETFERIIKYRDWDFCQIQLNYMDTEIQAGLKGYELAKELGVPLVIMEPAKGGALTNYAADVNRIFTDAAPDKSVASWAFRWVGSFRNVKVILSGMTKMEQLDDNLKTFDNFEPLTAEESPLVDKLVATVRARTFNGCTGCRYCVPCPGGVEIPRVFRIWNDYGMYNNANAAKRAYFHDMKPEARADNCLECGVCETACPQSLSIRENLKAAHSLFESLQKAE
ncbi:MAG: aldo/keto reductase [Lachnospiraceae bacterium]|nr:aldo/keto reductase [Lachnospiraceae bacterium]